MKWYLNSRNINLLQSYASYFPVYSQDELIASTDATFSMLPVNDLKVQKIRNEGFWQKIVNFFKGSRRYEIMQFDKKRELDKWQLNELEDELFRILRVGLKKKGDKISKMSSGKFSSDDSELFTLKLVEYAIYEIIIKAKSEHSRLMMYQRLLNLLKVMILDLSHKRGTGWLLEVMEMTIEKIDEMIQYESEQSKIRAFHDTVNDLRLGTLLRRINEDVVGSLTSKPMQEHIFYQGTRLNLAVMPYEEFIDSKAYQLLGRESKKLLSNKFHYELIREGWLKNSRNSKLFRDELNVKYLQLISDQNLSREIILKALKAKVTDKTDEAELTELADQYVAVFKKLNQLYIMNCLLTLVKERVSSFGQSAAILYQQQIRSWFSVSFELLDSLSQDLKMISAHNKMLIPYLNRHHGRGIFLTSKLTVEIDRLKQQIIQARQYMHVDQKKLEEDHNQFVALINQGLGFVKKSGLIKEDRFIEPNNNDRYRMFTPASMQPKQVASTETPKVPRQAAVTARAI